MVKVWIQGRAASTITLEKAAMIYCCFFLSSHHMKGNHVIEHLSQDSLYELLSSFQGFQCQDWTASPLIIDAFPCEIIDDEKDRGNSIMSIIQNEGITNGIGLEVFW
jgi:hypothetical protein